ncbi:MAG: FliA/WhiG family RNA polymerase sigma factor [Acidobacteriota bacterium]|nr:FliA/WhiG family RNA polymerase sigma factor [Acidobacteriota bacterium]
MALKLLPLVRRVAFEMRERLPQHVAVDDLAGAGVLGLLDAVRRYDPHKHVKIETYARYRIRGAILDSLRDMDTASRDMRRKCKAAEKVCHQLQMKLGRAVTDEEMAAALGMRLNDWHRTMQEISSAGVDWMRPSQIPEPSAADEASIPDEARDDAFDLCYRQEQKDLILKASSGLPGREREVIALYYGQDMTMNEIGTILRIDESRVSQIHSAAILHLRSRVRRMLNSVQRAVPATFNTSIASRPIEKAC